MTPRSDEEPPLDPSQVRIVARVRWLMLISGFATVIGIAVIIGVIGYRFFKSEGSALRSEVTARLPQGAVVLSTGVSGGRLAVTIDNGGTTEVYVFDLRTLQPTGRLRLEMER
jgi:hypothetical protein